jgi:hypothetical protein
MKRTALAILPLLLALSACNRAPTQQPEGHAATAATTGPAATGQADAGHTTPQRKKPSRQRLAEITASGKIGLWADPVTICEGTAAPVTLTWNVVEPKLGQVEIYMIGKAGKERLVARGAPTGERKTGRWVRSGMAFSLRASGKEGELQRVVIGGKRC